MLLILSIVRIVVLIENAAKNHISTIDLNANNTFLPKHFHVYELYPKDTSRTEKHATVCDTATSAGLYISMNEQATACGNDQQDFMNEESIVSLDKINAMIKLNPIPKTTISLCRIESDDVILLEIGSSTGQNYVNCSTSISVRYPIAFDVYILSNYQEFKFKKQLQSMRGNWPVLCTGIDNTLSAGSNGVAFAVEDSDLLRRGKLSLSYWLKVCGIDRLPVISQRPMGSIDASNGRRSSCRVLSVSSVSGGSERDSVLCLEDALIHLARNTLERRPTSDNEPNFILASFLGVESIADAFFGTQLYRADANTSIHEILDSIKAIQHVNNHITPSSDSLNSHFTFNIKSVWRNLLDRANEIHSGNRDRAHESGASVATMVRAIRSILKSHSQSEWDSRMRTLENSIDDVMYSTWGSIETQSDIQEMFFSLVQLFYSEVVSADGVVLGQVGSLFRTSAACQEYISNLLDKFMEKVALSRSLPLWLPKWVTRFYLRWAPPVTFSVESLFGRMMSPRRYTCPSSNIALTSTAEESLCKISYTIRTLNVSGLSIFEDKNESSSWVAGETRIDVAAGFVLLFVDKKDILAVKDLVSTWYRDCPRCNPVASYQYIIIPSLEGTSSFSKLMSLQALEFIRRVSASEESEALVILVGLPAARRFIPPKEKEMGILAHLSQTSYGRVTIDEGRVAFAAEVDDVCVMSCNELGLSKCPYTLAFGGRMKEMKSVLSTYSGVFGEHLTFRDHILLYFKVHPKLVTTDSKYRYFSVTEQLIEDDSDRASSVDDGTISQYTRGVDVQEMYSQALTFLRTGRLFSGIKLGYHCYKRSPDEVGPAFTSVIYEFSRRIVGNRGELSSKTMFDIIDFLKEVYFTNGLREFSDSAGHLVLGPTVPLKVRISRVNNHNQLINSLPALISNMYYLSGFLVESIDWFELSLSNVYFTEVQHQRKEWIEFKNSIKDDRGTIDLHILTTSTSDNDDNINNLVMSAKYAGVNVSVLNIEGKFTCAKKMTLIHTELQTNNHLKDDDFVLITDGYDVIFMPELRKVLMQMKDSSTPIKICSENVPYPDFAAPWVYPRHYNYNSPNRFLNGGCIVGRVKEVKKLYSYLSERTEIVNDDQLVLSEYFLRHPHILSLDSSEKFFQCGFREDPNSFSGLTDSGVPLFRGSEHPVALFHCNNRLSDPLYDKLQASLREWGTEQKSRASPVSV